MKNMSRASLKAALQMVCVILEVVMVNELMVLGVGAGYTRAGAVPLRHDTFVCTRITSVMYFSGAIIEEPYSSTILLSCLYFELPHLRMRDTNHQLFVFRIIHTWNHNVAGLCLASSDIDTNKTRGYFC